MDTTRSRWPSEAHFESHHGTDGTFDLFLSTKLPIAHLIEVPVKSAGVRGDVNVDNIPVLELPHIRNPVANALIDGGAHTLREIVVIQRGRVGVPLHARLVGL